MNIALVDNGVFGLDQYYVAAPGVRYRHVRVTARWRPDFGDDDVVLVPNGADHVALFEARHALAGVLARGGVVLCFCGFFTPWLPGNQWRHDIGAPLATLRYELAHDPLGLFDEVAPESLCVDAHGIRGGWACGAIDTAHEASVVLRDNVGRVLMVADRCSTRGLIIATASGPLWDDAPTLPAEGARRVYRNVLRACRAQLEKRHG